MFKGRAVVYYPSKICAVNIHLYTIEYTTMFKERAVVILSLKKYAP